MSIKQRAKDMGVSDLVREIERLREENKMLIEDLSSDRELQKQIAQKQVEYYDENKKLREEVDRLNKLVDKLHVDCVYYENHREPKDEGDEVENTECPF